MRFPRDPRLLAGAALVGASALLAAAMPAEAQYLYPPRVVVPMPVPHYGPLPPHEIAQKMMRRGFLEIDPPQMRGDVYVVTGIDERGDRVRLMLDAYDGEILRRTRYETERTFFAPPPSFPRPPRAVPYGTREMVPDDDEETFDERRVQRDIPPAERIERAPVPRRTSKLDQPRTETKADPAKTEAPKAETAKAEPVKKPQAPAAAAKTSPAPVAPPPVEAARPQAEPKATTAAGPEIRIPEPPAVPAPSVSAAETTGSTAPRAVRVIEGVTAAPADATKATE